MHRRQLTGLLYNQLPGCSSAASLGPWPGGSYQFSPPLLSDRDRRAVAGHSQLTERQPHTAVGCKQNILSTLNVSDPVGSVFIPGIHSAAQTQHSRLLTTGWRLITCSEFSLNSDFLIRLWFNLSLSHWMMSSSLIDCVSADQQNALKVVRASKPRLRKSSKVVSFTSFVFLLFYKA